MVRRACRAMPIADAPSPDPSLPCVVKPLGLSGSRGVIRADTPDELEIAVARVRALLARPAVRAMRTGLEDELLDRRLHRGREYAVEALLTDGVLARPRDLRQAGSARGPVLRGDDLRHAVRRYRRQCSARSPTRCSARPPRWAWSTGRFTPSAASARAGVVMLEVAARPIGGLCSKVLRFRDAPRAGSSPGGTAPRHACGEDVSAYAPRKQAAGVMMIPIPTRGVFKGVARRDRGPSSCRTSKTSGSPRRRTSCSNRCPEGDSYLGFIFARAADPDRGGRRLCVRRTPSLDFSDRSREAQAAP